MLALPGMIVSLALATTPARAGPLIAAAGDIACDPAQPGFNAGLGTNNACHQMRTSNLLVGTDLAGVLTLGDNQYECGSYASFLQSYDPSWGRVKSITHPAVGNHEYQTSPGADCDPTGQASGYFDYFDGLGNSNGPAGERGKGYYSFDIGAWHLIALNSNCSKVSCSTGSPQESWLRSNLAANPSRCTLAYWHHPRFSSGATHGDTPSVTPFWQALYDNGADLVLSGHEHVYERFAQQTPTGVADPVRGIREFIVGTGGKNHYTFGAAKPNSEARDSTTFGVLELTLHPAGYDWAFVPEEGGTFTDAGSGICHSAADLSISKTDTPDPVGVGQTLTYTLTVQNNGPATTGGVKVSDQLPASVSFISANASQGSCTQSAGTVSCDLGTVANGNSATVTIDVTPQSVGTITNSASVQGTAPDPVNGNNGAEESTVVDALPATTGYARPKAATPINLRLVPAYELCSTPDSTHGLPLAAASCDPPRQASSELTIGSPDANGRPANSTGSVQLQVLGESPIDQTNGNQADVKTTVSFTDVLNRADLSDYTGELEFVATLRVTDRNNGVELDQPATVIDLPFRFAVPCAATLGREGASCQLTTTVNGVMPDVAHEGKRAIWALQGIDVLDGGVDGLASTPDNTLFATQGLLAP